MWKVRRVGKLHCPNLVWNTRGRLLRPKMQSGGWDQEVGFAAPLCRYYMVSRVGAQLCARFARN